MNKRGWLLSSHAPPRRHASGYSGDGEQPWRRRRGVKVNTCKTPVRLSEGNSSDVS